MPGEYPPAPVADTNETESAQLDALESEGQYPTETSEYDDVAPMFSKETSGVEITSPSVAQHVENQRMMDAAANSVRAASANHLSAQDQAPSADSADFIQFPQEWVAEAAAEKAPRDVIDIDAMPQAAPAEVEDFDVATKAAVDKLAVEEPSEYTEVAPMFKPYTVETPSPEQATENARMMDAAAESVGGMFPKPEARTIPEGTASIGEMPPEIQAITNAQNAERAAKAATEQAAREEAAEAIRKNIIDTMPR